MSDIDSESADGTVKDLSEFKGPKGCVLRWLKEIELVKNSKMQKAYERIGEKIVKNYRNAESLQAYQTANVSPARVMVNILWSNVQVLKPSLYSRMPKVVVERRYKDSDPVGRLASQICERATSFMLSDQQDRFNYAVKAAVEDRLLVGRGQAWIRYDVDFASEPEDAGETISSDEVPSEVEQEQNIKPGTERAIVDYVYWQDYFESVARGPYEVRWKAKRAYMTRAKLVRRFGPEIGNKVELNKNPNDLKKNKLNGDEPEFLMQAEVYEIWDRDTMSVYWISEGYKEAPLDCKKDPLKLKDFFPCPLPLMATTTTDSTYPTPDYKIYERLAEELDYTAKRISAMVDCIRFVGATAAQFNSDVKNMLKLDDGQLWPVENWAAWSEKGGFKGVMDWLPFDNAVAAIGPLMEYQQSLYAQINEVTGIPDIVRGSTDPNETLGVQQKKSHWVMVKLAEKQADVQRFCRDIISKIAEVIFEVGLFSDESIALMCGVGQMPPEDQANFPYALQLLRSDEMRTFRVDIETDSTIAVDEEDDKAARMEYMSALTNVIGNLQNISQFRPELIKPMIESALFATRAFRTGRPLEGAWEKAMQEIEDNDAAAAEQAAQQPPPPDYDMQKLQLQGQELQIKQMDAQVKADTAMQEIQLKGQELQLKSQEMQANFEIESQRVQIEGLKVQSEAQVKATAQELETFKAQFAQQVEAQRVEIEKYKAVLSEKEKMIEENRLQKQEQLDALKFAHERERAINQDIKDLGA
jgi:hypothetical protein